jgi:hypothetical protein
MVRVGGAGADGERDQVAETHEPIIRAEIVGRPPPADDHRGARCFHPGEERHPPTWQNYRAALFGVMLRASQEWLPSGRSAQYEFGGMGVV